MTNTYLTGNPLGSTAPKDLYDNASNFDEAMNFAGPAFTDRFGKRRETWAGMEAQFQTFLQNSGFEPTHLTYVDGSPLNVLRPTQLIDRDGLVYRVKLPASFPVALTGTWATDSSLLAEETNDGLRADLADALQGANLVAYMAPWAGAVPQTVDLKLGQVVSVEDFGADPTGATDSTAAIQAAINSGAGRITFGPGVFMIGAAGLRGVSNQAWTGAGRGVTILRQAVPPTKDPVFIQQKTNFDIRGIWFDGNGMLTAGVGNFPSLLPSLHISECTNFNVSDCKFTGFYNMGPFANESQDFTILNNIVDRGGFENFINHGIGVSGAAMRFKIEGNNCFFCQISANGLIGTIRGNQVTRWGFSAGINTQALASCGKLLITDNICYNPRQGPDISPYDVGGIENWGADSIIANNICYENFGNGIDNGGRRCIIANNTCFNNRNYGIFLLGQDSTFKASDCLVIGNKMYDTREGGFRYQQGGYVEQPGAGLTGIIFAHNMTTNNIGPNIFNCTDRATFANYDYTPVSAFTNSWVSFVGSTAPAGYTKSVDNQVELRGQISSGVVGQIAFTLPVGHRPEFPFNAQVCSNNAFGMVIVGADGTIRPFVGNNAYFTLDGIRFRAAG